MSGNDGFSFLILALMVGSLDLEFQVSGFGRSGTRMHMFFILLYLTFHLKNFLFPVKTFCLLY